MTLEDGGREGAEGAGDDADPDRAREDECRKEVADHGAFSGNKFQRLACWIIRLIVP